MYIIDNIYFIQYITNTINNKLAASTREPALVQTAGHRVPGVQAAAGARAEGDGGRHLEPGPAEHPPHGRQAAEPRKPPPLPDRGRAVPPLPPHRGLQHLLLRGVSVQKAGARQTCKRCLTGP